MPTMVSYCGWQRVTVEQRVTLVVEKVAVKYSSEPGGLLGQFVVLSLHWLHAKGGHCSVGFFFPVDLGGQGLRWLKRCLL